MKRNRAHSPRKSVSSSLARGISDLTDRGDVPSEGSQEILPVETALLSLCHEVAGTLIRGLQSDGNPSKIRKLVSERLREKLEIERAQADCLVELSIELIRVKSMGRYQRNPIEMGSLIAGALGNPPAEGFN
jgi:hypothetical protein